MDPSPRTLPRFHYPPDLPVTGRKEEIVRALRHSPVVVVAGETGSGKTTQIPKACVEAGFVTRGRLVCTQPRRIAALTVARRIAEETGSVFGKEVGCAVRFDDRTDPSTVVKIATDGLLLAETRRDPLLSAYDVIMVDEAHERSVNIDLLLGHLKNIVARRPSLRVVVTSATIDTKLFSDFFGGAPVVEVTGRLHPVEIRYEPTGGLAADDEGAVTYVDAAVACVGGLLAGGGAGDVLVFMPTERDVLETRERLAAGCGPGTTVLPLTGRLSTADQERVFAPVAGRKVVVATNVAETSLTVPGVRYVVDTGLARVSRYAPRSRTRRLPVEPVAQSNADQRAGRAGRVSAGVCVRLYPEDDFLARPRFGEPEMRRANLADVILRMKAFGLGDFSSFPLLDPPPPAAVKAGLALLRELGALGPDDALTGVGREMARLPIDVTAARMVIQARREHVVPEVLAVAAGLSVRDPRERPLEKRQVAETVHRTFDHPASDFLTLLNLWSAYHSRWEEIRTQSGLRKFCKEHYLSYSRMREWVDVRRELSRAAGGDDAPPGDVSGVAPGDGRYRAIHRSVLAGLLSGVGVRTDRNAYLLAGRRPAALAPGSALSERRGRRRADAAARGRRRGPPSAGWIVAGDAVETERLTLRTAAPVEPAWIEDVGGHVCRRTLSDVRFDPGRGRVVARERVTFYGLELAVRSVSYGAREPEAAAAVFVEEALVPAGGAADLHASVAKFRFAAENLRTADRLTFVLSTGASLGLSDLAPHELLKRFYAERLPGVSSVAGLADVVRREGNAYLTAGDDLLPEAVRPGPEWAALYPEIIEAAGERVAVTYRYDPSGGRDGATVTLPADLASRLPPGSFDRAVPGFVPKVAGAVVRGYARTAGYGRAEADRLADRVASRVSGTGGLLLDDVAASLAEMTGAHVSAEELRCVPVPEQWTPRFEVTDAEGRVVAEGRDLSRFAAASAAAPAGRAAPLAAVAEARARLGRHEVTDWDFGDLAERVPVTSVAGSTLFLYPGLADEEGRVALRLFDSRADAVSSHRHGFDRLLGLRLRRPLAALKEGLREIDRLGLDLLFLPGRALRETAYRHLTAYLFEREEEFPGEVAFRRVAVQAESRIVGLLPAFLGALSAVLTARAGVARRPTSFPGKEAEIARLAGPDFLLTTPYRRLPDLVRYLRAVGIRAERYESSPGRDREREEVVSRYAAEIPAREAAGDHEFRFLVEELRVSLFAQELGTAVPVSPKRLDKRAAGDR